MIDAGFVSGSSLPEGGERFKVVRGEITTSSRQVGTRNDFVQW